MSATAMGMALDVTGISPRSKLVLIALCNSADEASFEGFPSRRHLARAADCSIDTIDRCLRELADHGLLRKQERDRDDGKGQTSNLYRVFPTFDPSRKNAAPTSDPAAKVRPGGNAEVRPPQPHSFAAPPAAKDAAPKEPLSEPTSAVAVASARGRENAEMAKIAKALAGDAVNLTSGHVHSGQDLRMLLTAGCDWLEDVVPAIEVVSAGILARSGKLINSWRHPGIVETALQYRDRRLAGLPAPSKPTERTNGRASADGDAWDRVLAEMEDDAASGARPAVALGQSRS